MKINCQSCGAKYTIADEKVRGRTVKIRCKKCSSAIVVKGPEEMPPPEEEEEDDATRVYSGGEVPEGLALSIPPQGADPGWMVTLDDGAQREGSVEELRAMYEAGTIHDDSYVWREGMTDWKTLADTPELQSALRGRAGRSVPPRPSRPASTTAGSPNANLGGGLFGGGGAAARVDTRGRDQDLFGAPEQRPPEEEVATSAPSNPMAKPVIPKFTAERGENSVLFTIDTMKAMGNQPMGPAKPASVAPSGDEKIDIGALASVAPPPMMGGGDFDQTFDPGPGFGGGGGGGGSLAAPMLPTTIEPEPIPEPEPMPQYPGSFEPQPKSNKGIVIGLGAAVALLLVVSLAFGGYVLFGKDEAPVAANATTEGTEKATADTDKDTTDNDTTDNDKKDDDAKDDEDKADAGDDDEKDAEVKDDDKKAAADKANVKATATPKLGGPLPTSTAKKDDKKKDDKKKDDAKKDDAKDDPKPPAATADRKFSRSAAISALGAAAGAASGCKKPGGPTGRGRVSVTFAPSGRVTTANVSGAPFAGTSVGGCVAATFRRASVPPFDGSPVTVHKSFTIN
jgi:predicted Zn finger-like uncharacterized protein